MVIKGGLYTNHFILYFLWVCFKSCLSELCCQSCCTPLSGNDVLSSSKRCCCGLLSLPFSSYCICAFSSFWLNPDSPSLGCAQSCTRFVSSLPRICLPQFVILVFNLPQTYHPWCDIIPGFSSFLDGWLQQLLALNTWCHLKMLLERGCRKPVLGLTEHRQMICMDSKTKEIFLVWPRAPFPWTPLVPHLPCFQVFWSLSSIFWGPQKSQNVLNLKEKKKIYAGEN